MSRFDSPVEAPLATPRSGQKGKTTNTLRSRPMRAKHMICSKVHKRTHAGFTLIELMVATTILAILTMMALPLARVTIQREKEKQLREALWEMRDAIDRYKDAADRQVFQIKVDSMGYPPIWTPSSKVSRDKAARNTVFCVLFPRTP